MVMLQYRGAGGLPGQPSEEILPATPVPSTTSWTRLWETSPRTPVLHGFSRVPAWRSAGIERPFAGVVLEAALPVVHVFSAPLSRLALCLLMWARRHDSRRRITRIDAQCVWSWLRIRVVPFLGPERV